MRKEQFLIIFQTYFNFRIKRFSSLFFWSYIWSEIVLPSLDAIKGSSSEKIMYDQNPMMTIAYP